MLKTTTTEPVAAHAQNHTTALEFTRQSSRASLRETFESFMAGADSEDLDFLKEVLDGVCNYGMTLSDSFEFELGVCLLQSEKPRAMNGLGRQGKQDGGAVLSQSSGKMAAACDPTDQPANLDFDDALSLWRSMPLHQAAHS